MTPALLSENLTTDIEACLADLIERLPMMTDVVRAFGTLAQKRQDMALPPCTLEERLDAEAFSRGVPLLGERDLSGLEGCLPRAAQELLSTLGNVFPPVAPAAAALEEVLGTRPGLSLLCLKAVLGEDREALGSVAAQVAIPPETLLFLLLEVLKPCLRKACDVLGPLADDDLWSRGRCPVCGSSPDLGFLKEKKEPSEYLISRAGRLWLHCALCGHIWRFVRLVCPGCGQEDHERLDILTVAGQEKERLHLCRACNRYLPVFDLVESGRKLHPDLAPLALVPLDMLAQEQGFEPLAHTPWNRFS